MKTFRKTLFAVALTAGIFTSFPALAENCVKPNLGGLTHRQKVENYPEMVDCAYRNVLAAKNADGNWVYLDNKTGKVLFTFPNGKRPGGIYNFHDGNFTLKGDPMGFTAYDMNEWRNRTSFHNGIDAFLDYGLIKTETIELLNKLIAGTTVIDKEGNTILNIDKPMYDLYIFAKNGTIIGFGDFGDKVFLYNLEGKTKNLFSLPADNIFHSDTAYSGKREHVAYNLGRMVANGLIPVESNGRKGYVDLSGNIVIPIEHKTLDNFSEGLVRAGDPKNDEFIGYLDKTGKVVIPYEYNNNNNDDKDFTNGVARVCQDTCFYINKQGKKVVKGSQNKSSKKRKK